MVSMGFFMILGLIILSGECQNVNYTCGEPSCPTYTCLEKIAQCGDDGYLIGYGYKNCISFNDHYNDFNNLGKDFTDCATYCLPNWLEAYFEERNNKVSCSRLQTDALESHVQCFLECGFCGMWFSNIITLAKVLDVKDFLSLDAAKTVLQVLYGCVTGQGK